MCQDGLLPPAPSELSSDWVLGLNDGRGKKAEFEESEFSFWVSLLPCQVTFNLYVSSSS